MSKNLRILLSLGVLLVLATGAASDSDADRAVLLHDATLYVEASSASAVVARLAANATVDVRGRQGLWMYVTTDAVAERGWLRLTEIRLTGASGAGTAAAQPAGGAFVRLSRSLSGLLGGLRGREQRTAHATIGIRGLTGAELQTAAFDEAAMYGVTDATASAEQARAFASAGGLTARAVPILSAGVQP